MVEGAITTRERSAFIALAALGFAYVFVRALVVPLVHDEAASYLWFVQPGELLPFHAHWDANNHVVNTLCGWVGDRLFGTSLLTLRWGNVAAFAIYLLTTYRLGRWIGRPFPRWLCWCALLFCPFVIDLFALFRGYGIGVAGLLFAVERSMAYADSGRTARLWTGLLALAIAVYADLSLIPPAVILLGLFVLHALRYRHLSRRSNLSAGTALLVLGAVPLACAVHLALLMQQLGLLYHGSLAGFVPVTVGSLVHYTLGTGYIGLVYVVAIYAGAMLALGMAVAAVRRAPDDLLLTSVILLFGEVAARLFLGHAQGVNFPEDRAAVHLVPLFIVCVAALADVIAERHPWRQWLALPLVVLPLRTFFTANLDHTVLWPEQSVPSRFVRAVAELQRAADRPLLVGGYHQLALCWPLGARLQQQDVPLLQTEGFPNGAHDLRIVDGRFMRQAKPGYREVDYAAGPGLWLLERETPLVLAPIDTITTAGGTSDAEFQELGHLPLEALRAGALVADIRFGLDCPYPTLEVNVVIEVNDSTGNKLFYDSVSPLALRADWHGDSFHVARGIPACPTATRAVLYIYNKEHRGYTITAPVVTVAAVYP
ncbi:MAG TPA: hypothetical protein VHL57_00395 [Flavobacteriales bacterium]|jgi:hypothetical protein|nr:hypothetical protein [Flavobacteriales bacterium]